MATIAPFRGYVLQAARAPHAASTWELPAHAGAALLDLAARTARGEFVRDQRAALYRYELDFGPPDDRRRTPGFLARILVADLPPPLSTADATDPRRGLVPVVLRYKDERGWVDEVLSSNAYHELLRVTDAEGNEHRLYRIDRSEAIQEVVAQFEDRPLRLEGPLGTASAGNGDRRPAPDAAILALLVPEGPGEAPWRAGWIAAGPDEPRPRPWQELAGDPGPAQWRPPPLH